MGAELVFKYFPNLPEYQQEQIRQLYDLYSSWNARINVVSRKDIDQLYLRHVLHSLAIQKFFQFSPGMSVLDIGTGGGFPGIPLAILNPECKFHLVDSIGKKITVVQEVAKGIGLKNVKADHLRAEKSKRRYHTVVTRAVAQTNVILEWIGNKIEKGKGEETPRGLVALKGGDLTEELSKVNRPCQVVNITDYFEEDFFETKKIVFIPY